MFVMILLLYRSIVGYQDDIVTRTVAVARHLFVGGVGRSGHANASASS